MKSLLLLGLTGLAANVGAHPQRRQPHEANLSKRGTVNLDSFRLPELSTYTDANVTESSDKIAAIGKRDTYVETAKELVKTVAPKAEFRLVEDHYVGTNGIAHVNFKQTIHGIDIDNADFNVNVAADGKIFSYGNSFYDGPIPQEKPVQKRDTLDPVDALKGGINVLNLPVKAEKATVEPKDGENHVTIKGTSGAVKDPEARLVYFNKGDNKLVLTWRVETDVDENWLLSYVDAKDNTKVHGVVDYVSDLATYEVYPWGVIDPTKGSQTTLTEPWLLDASEYTWVGDASTKYTTTRGNNGIAHTNPTGGSSYLNNYRPQSSALTFEYPYSPATANKETYRDASVTQLFYTANHYHDLLYKLGFTESAGNFQTSNADKGGRGGDSVILNAQDGASVNNAQFSTPPDGQAGIMKMFMWTLSTPQRDGSFDAGVVIHEYTHGLSTRLTGGPSNSGCLSGVESGGMGEGWSDFFAIAVGLQKGDTRNTDHVVGSWVYNNAKGIRTYPYSTSLTTNPYTHTSISSLSGVHAYGTVWATILYEVLWNLIEKHGQNDAEFPSFDNNGVPTDGKYLAMKIVLDGLALQPCSPTFVSARNAIIDADKALTGGDNKCEIWKGFAKRGLGEKAVAGSRRTNDFTVPAGC